MCVDLSLEVYELNLKKHPNRFNALHGAGLAAEKAGNIKKAKLYYEQLISVANQTNSSRTEINTAKQFLERTAHYDENEQEC